MKGGKETENEPLIKGPKKADKLSIYIMLFCNFLSSVCFSIVLPSLWPFISHLKGTESIVGWAVAVNSAGSFLASPVFGYWLDRRGTREVLCFSLIVMVLGNLLYFFSPNIYVLLTARFLVGIAAGNYTVAQTYLSYASTAEDRTKIMAYNSATTVLGFIFGPSFALVLAFIPDIPITGEIELNQYTSPGLLSAVLSFGALCAAFFLKEVSKPQPPQESNDVEHHGTQGRLNAKQNLAGSVSTYNFPGSRSDYNYAGSGYYTGAGSVEDIKNIVNATKPGAPKIPWIPVSLCLYFYFCYTAAFTTWETIGTPYTEKAYGWNIYDNSLMFAAMGLACIIALIILQLLTRWFGDRVLLLGSVVLTTVGSGILISWWDYTPAWRWLLGASLASIGYGTSVAVLVSLYSKILESLEQGMLMGWLSSSGSLSRIVGPIVASYALEYGGSSGRAVFLFVTGMCFSALVLNVIFYKKLLPKKGLLLVNE